MSRIRLAERWWRRFLCPQSRNIVVYGSRSSVNTHNYLRQSQCFTTSKDGVATMCSTSVDSGIRAIGVLYRHADAPQNRLHVIGVTLKHNPDVWCQVHS